MSKPYKRGLFVFQRDLRIEDQRGLSAALEQCESLFLVSIVDLKRSKLSIDTLSTSYNLQTRLNAYYNLEQVLEKVCTAQVKPLITLMGDTVQLVEELCNLKALGIEAVFANTVMEPSFLKAYQKLSQRLEVALKLYKDHEVVSESKLINKSGTPYKVFTPFHKVWRSLLNPLYYGESLLAENWVSQIMPLSVLNSPILKDAHLRWEDSFAKLKALNAVNPAIHTQRAQIIWANFKANKIKAYSEQRDFPAENGTSELALYINNGLISYRQLVRESLALKEEAFLRQLAWRHFYILILFYFPKVETESFIESFKNLPWENNAEKIEAWKNGNTGFDIIDAAMRELKATGQMHNRLRMIVASFLVKHLDVNWQIGEAYFYEMLADGDLALNNGGWQWCASTGNDAQPYFRIFNPIKQAQTYDANALYRNKWLSEDKSYRQLSPIVDLKLEGQRSMLKYKLAKKGSDTDEDNGCY